MPLVHYACKCGHTEKKFIRQVKDIPAFLDCNICHTDKLKKQLSAPSSGSIIVIDNGVQSRKVEIVPNIIEINKARSEKDYSEED